MRRYNSVCWQSSYEYWLSCAARAHFVASLVGGEYHRWFRSQTHIEIVILKIMYIVVNYVEWHDDKRSIIISSEYSGISHIIIIRISVRPWPAS